MALIRWLQSLLLVLGLNPVPTPPLPPPPPAAPSILIVPHHNLVHQLRTQTFSEFASLRPQTRLVILVGPDHFSANQNRISYGIKTWNTASGQLQPPKNLPALSNLAADNLPLVEHDHAVFNLLDNLTRFFPGTDFLPILIGQDVPLSHLTPLSNYIANHCLADCLLVASVDASHYLPAPLADVHDYETLDHLSSLTLKYHQDIEVDSPQAVFLALKHARHTHAPRFHLFAHTNSASYTQNPFIPSTSHFFGWFQPGDPLPRNLATETLIASPLPPDPPTMEDRFRFGVDCFSHLTRPRAISPTVTIAPGLVTTLAATGSGFLLTLAPTATASAVTHPDGTFFLALTPADPALQAQLITLNSTPSGLPFLINPAAQTLTSPGFPTFATMDRGLSSP